MFIVSLYPTIVSISVHTVDILIQLSNTTFHSKTIQCLSLLYLLLLRPLKPPLSPIL